MYAIIESCGKQYKVAEKDVIFFEKLDAEVGKKVKFDNVILVSDGEKIEIGNPYVKGFKVEGTVVEHGKGKKIIVFKYKPKKNYKRKQGHRQPYTKVEITSIKKATEKAATEADKTVEENATVEVKKTATEAKKTTTAEVKKTTTKKATTAKSE